MNVPQIRSLAIILVCLTALAGCNRSNDAEVAKVKAEADAAKAKADAEVARVQEETTKVVPAQPKAVDINRAVAEWVQSVGGELRVRVDGKEVSIGKDDRLPSERFQMVFIGIAGRNVTNDGIGCLSGLKELDFLYAEGNPQLTDFTFLKALSNLVILNLADTGIDDASLVHMHGMTKLSYLNIGSKSGNQITDAGLEHLSAMTSIQHLTLIGTGATDAGLEKIKGLKELTHLAIGSHTDQSEITDAGLAQLTGLSTLTNLTILNTRITDGGIAQFKKELPDVKIDGR
jgi:hypothetical protein